MIALPMMYVDEVTYRRVVGYNRAH